jgi:hypothetical protein
MADQFLIGLVLVFITIFQANADAELNHSLDNLANGFATQDVNLIGIGETHREKNQKRLYLELLPRLQKFFKKPFCLLIEAPESGDRRLATSWPIREAVAMNIAVFGVDKPHAKLRYSPTKSRIESLNERDIYMAKKISTLFKSNTCRSALLINGANHYRNFAHSRISLKSRLRDSSLVRPHFILRRDNEFFNSNGATEWEWLPGQYEDFDSVMFGRYLF